MTLNFPSLDCSLLFPDLINFHMERNPSFPAYVYVNERVPNTITEISLLEFGRAAHRVAHALRPSRRGFDGEVVMVIANTDTILYHAVVCGVLLAGWVPFPVSPRNSAVAMINMMNETNCSRIVTLEQDHKGLIDAICRDRQAAKVIIYELPPLHYAFPKLGCEVITDPFVPYPPPFRSPDLDSPAIYIHSSGSTGLPKPIRHTHRIQIQWLKLLTRQCADLPPPRRIAGMALPEYHMFGIFIGLYEPIAALATTVVYPPRTENHPLTPRVVPTSDNIIETLKNIECNGFMAVPALLEQMVMSEEDIEILKKLNRVYAGGGPLPVQVGDKLCAAGVQITNGYGGTEFGAPIMLTDKKDIADGDWMWMRFIDDLKIRWIPQGDDTYELQVLYTDKHPVAVENIPDVRGYATSDVFRKHPTKDAWRIVGRADDVIVHASGEKTVPAPIESAIGSSPLVQGVVMFGRERNQAGVLIEPRAKHAIDINDAKAVTEFRNRIWPVIEEANKPSPLFSRVFKEMILITSKDKPMSRVSKGTVQRRPTLDAYEAEINALYDSIGASSVTPNGLVGPSTWTSEALGLWLLEHAHTINSGGPNMDPSADLFSQGFDSLSATYLRNLILGSLRRSSDPAAKQAATNVTLNVIYTHPTIQQLSEHISALVHNNDSGETANVVEQHEQAMCAMIEKFSVGFDGPADGVLPSSEPIVPAVVLLTGTTGGLGSFLLSALLQHPSVQRVYAFNRPSTRSIEERQKMVFTDKGLGLDLLDSDKLVYVEANASLDMCGLSATQYEEICNSVTLIIHTAWRLDFNLALSSFEDSIRASRHLINLALDSPKKERLRFLFTSSIASAQGCDNSKGPFPEQVLLDPSVAIGGGYGESKYVTERIIVKSGLHVTSLRIGQIAGGQGGSWTTTDWFPIIVKSSIALGALPESTGVVSWLREEEVVAAILDTAFATQAPPPALNIVNPQSAPWTSIMAFVQRAMERRKGLSLPIIPFGEWFAHLEKRAENVSEADLTQIPAIKLLEFMRVLARGEEAIQRLTSTEWRTHQDYGRMEVGGLPNFCTTEAQRVSPTMARVQAIGEAEADAWVGYWVSKGGF